MSNSRERWANHRHQAQSLTNKDIQDLGQTYYKDHPPPPEGFWSRVNEFFKLHNNHHLADQLKAYNKNEGVQKKWEFLLDIYRQLPNANGTLAESIEGLFMRCFRIGRLKKAEAGGSGGSVYPYPVSQIACQLSVPMEAHFKRVGEELAERKTGTQEAARSASSSPRSR